MIGSLVENGPSFEGPCATAFRVDVHYLAQLGFGNTRRRSSAHVLLSSLLPVLTYGRCAPRLRPGVPCSRESSSPSLPSRSDRRAARERSLRGVLPACAFWSFVRFEHAPGTPGHGRRARAVAGFLREALEHLSLPRRGGVLHAAAAARGGRGVSPRSSGRRWHSMRGVRVLAGQRRGLVPFLTNSRHLPVAGWARELF